MEILLNSGSGAVLDDHHTKFTSVFMGESDAQREERERRQREVDEDDERELMA